MRYALKMKVYGMIKKSELFIWLLPRIVIIAIFKPAMLSSHFLPFILHSQGNLMDPWTSWLVSGGNKDAFPYGPVMYLFFFPSKLILAFLSQIANTSNLSLVAIWLMTIQVLILDFVVTRKIIDLAKWNFSRLSGEVIIIISSPIFLYVCYIEGQLDLVPVSLLVFSFTLFRQNKWLLGGVFVGTAVAAKFSLMIPLPFIFLYLFFHNTNLNKLRHFFVGSIGASLFTILPAIYSTGYLKMVLGTPVTRRILSVSLNFASYELFILPVLIVSLLWWFWNLNRANVKILIAFLGAALLAVGSAQLFSMGWILWSLPSIILLISRSSNRTISLYLMWQGWELLTFAYSSGQLVTRFGYDLSWDINESFNNFNFTISIILSTILILKILSEALIQGDPFELNNQPFSILIAGDSGAGKDTLSGSIANAFGEKRTVNLRGDDYHLFERSNKVWSKITHLNPKGNDLQLLAQNYNRALNRRSFSFREYDHVSGNFTPPKSVQSGDLIILNGLHAFEISTSYKADLKIFLEIEDELRLQLKMSRDSRHRNHVLDAAYMKKMEERKHDYQTYVAPQKRQADLIIRTESVELNQCKLITKITSTNINLLQSISDIFVHVTGNPAHSMEDSEGAIWYVFYLDELSSDENREILKKLYPDAIDLFPGWEESSLEPGNIGFITLVSLVHLFEQRLGRR
jgi:uridine kinase